MRVVVCGSRSWSDRRRIAARLGELPDDTVIVVGYDPEHHRPRGADQIAYETARSIGLEIEAHPARWDDYGKAAGFIRNSAMAEAGADLCIAFWDGRSTGTDHMTAEAERFGIPVELHRA